MKVSTLFTCICALVASASAALEVTIPDSYTEWYSGYTGLVQWNSSASEFGLLCNIQLVDVETTEAVYNLTNASIPCSLDNYTTPILPSFDNQVFTVRIGETNNASLWSYTENFEILPQKYHDKNQA
ncbi:hypothetical protein MAM1_0216c08171 [Mucor ambiguus]|uniref:Uncharacterized protein n=1 Tax=Mucor ambiguus TaxID=91626 RepID=A0A0C9MDE5_9FUNG|nr:hypothetical protein MAM1_0216c08171 [Mucor ambiguus]